jgi:hypothetical protein
MADVDVVVEPNNKHRLYYAEILKTKAILTATCRENLWE